MANRGEPWRFETVAGDRVVRVAVRQETEPCGGWAVRGSPRHEPNRGSSVPSVRTAAVCRTVVNTKHHSRKNKKNSLKNSKNMKKRKTNLHQSQVSSKINQRYPLSNGNLHTKNFRQAQTPSESNFSKEKERRSKKRNFLHQNNQNNKPRWHQKNTISNH